MHCLGLFDEGVFIIPIFISLPEGSFIAFIFIISFFHNFNFFSYSLIIVFRFHHNNLIANHLVLKTLCDNVWPGLHMFIYQSYHQTLPTCLIFIFITAFWGQLSLFCVGWVHLYSPRWYHTQSESEIDPTSHQSRTI